LAIRRDKGLPGQQQALDDRAFAATVHTRNDRDGRDIHFHKLIKCLEVFKADFG